MSLYYDFTAWLDHLLGRDTKRQVESKRAQLHRVINQQTAKMIQATSDLAQESERYQAHVERHQREMEAVAAKIARAAGR